MKKNLIIVGCGEFGEMVYEFFSSDSNYVPVAFAVEKRFKNEEFLLGLPILEFESIKQQYPTNEYELFIAVTYVHLNEERKRLYSQAKAMGYKLASYIHPSTTVSSQVTVGENVLVMENCVLQKGVKVGTGTIIWCGSVISHGSKVGQFSWVAPRTAIAGFTKIGNHVFLGVNSTVADMLEIADKIVVGAGGVVNHSLTEPDVYVGCPVRSLGGNSLDNFYEK